MKIKNCTPHPIDVWSADCCEIIRTIPKSDIVIRLEEVNEQIGEVNGVPISRTRYGKPIDLPEEESDVLLIVSVFIKNALPDRKDLLIPVELVRDEKGEIIGCRSLSL